MRTVDPTQWSNRIKGRKMSLARPLRFGAPGGLEARLRDSFGDAMREFRRNCSIGGVRRIANEDTRQCERYSWMLLLTISLLAGSLTISLNMADLVGEPPLLINLHSAQHSMTKLPFPAVALCSYGVISQRALAQVSDLFLSVDANRTYTAAAMRRNLLDSGALLSLALPDVDLQFAHYLQDRGLLNISALMLRLSPTCESMLQKCSWAGRERPCDRLFATRITSAGFCCVFNGRYEAVDRDTPPKMLSTVGADNGLSVIIKEDGDDFAYVRKPTDAMEVLIFDGLEYPFLEGGAVRVQLAPRNTSAYFTITTRAQFASPNLGLFSEDWRGCRIQRPDGPYWRRSYSWCLLECLRHATLRLCGCIPYSLQPRTQQVCTLNELSCLNKYRGKFLHYHPIGYTLEHPAGEALSEELQDALLCDRCRADCARPIHSATPYYAAYQQRDMNILKNQFTSGVSLTNVTILHFFYASEDQHMYAVEINSNWFETFALLGSQWVIMLGISLIALFELLYYCTVRWRHHYVRRRRLFANIGV